MATDAQLGEVLRLAEIGGEPAIVDDVVARLAGRWIRVSRFADVDALTSRFVDGEPGPLLLGWAGRARDALGDRTGALEMYERALPILDEVGDRAGEAGTLNNIGMVHWARGELEVALGYFERALPVQGEVGDRAAEAATLNNIGMVHWARGELEVALGYFERALATQEAVGDRAGQAVTRHNVAMIYRDQGRLAEAVAELERVVELDAAVQHPDLAADTALLEQVRAELGRG